MNWINEAQKDFTTFNLKKSIDYEQARTAPTNLLMHSRKDLSLMIECIESKKKELEIVIGSRLFLLDTAEDMAEGLDLDQRAKIDADKEKLETLLAFRMLYLSAWQQVKK